MSIFLERIRAFAEKKKISLRQLSMSVGLSGAYLSNSLKQGSAPSVDIISKIIDEYPDLNPYWLLTGKGDMITDLKEEDRNEDNQWQNQSIDEIIDNKIDVRLKGLSGIIRELIINEMEDELERAKKDVENTKGDHIK